LLPISVVLASFIESTQPLEIHNGGKMVGLEKAQRHKYLNFILNKNIYSKY